MTRLSVPRGLPVALLSVCALTLGACERGNDQSGARDRGGSEQTESAAAPDMVYEGILGVVSSLPVEGQPASSFKIQHEHIPTFVSPTTGELNINADGVPGMRAMVMDMPPADAVDISGFTVGDKVRFTFAVWHKPISWKLTAIERVPADTEISFDDKPAP